MLIDLVGVIATPGRSKITPFDEISVEFHGGGQYLLLAMGAIERVPRSEVRASDGDRDQTAVRLRRAYADGCLETAELEERLQTALTARTRGELKTLTADLPRKTRPTRERIEQAQRRAFREHATTYGAVNTGLVAIWAATGADASFWPIWSIGPWGILLWMHGRTTRKISRRLGRG